MSRRKQTNPFKVNWLFHTPGLADSEHTLEMDVRDDFAEDSECHSNNSQEDDSYSDLDNHGEDSSSNTSVDDSMTGHKHRRSCSQQEGGVKEESKEGDDLESSYVCPLCSLEFSHSEHLIAHVYQHTTAVGGSKSYVCPVCGRALSSPGSLGRHLLIHSEDRLSNCAVCGSRFTDTTNFNREKLKDFFHASSMDLTSSGSGCLDGSFSMAPRPIPSGGPTPPSGPSLPSLPDSLLSSSTPPSLPPLPDPLCPSGGAGLPPLPDLLSPMPVYPAGVLLVCNSCAAYQQLTEANSPVMRRWASRRRNEPLASRMHRLERERTAKKSKRACETPDERELRRLRDREAKRLQRLQESEEQRSRRLQRDREAMRMKRANETPDKRQARLVREREAKRLKRRLEKIEPALRMQIEHDPAAMAALTADMSLFQFPFPLQGGGGVTPPASAPSSLDNGLFMRLGESVPQLPLALRPLGPDCKMGVSGSAQNQ
ncbi:zinc finger protein 821 isoform X2 [Clupea harengus]|uniref:Zinc finger protein 821 isoform X2 n=1 Tax=Clupea harengus TaxID=7950 RepID=A0A6P8F9R4_CLUHA|nr:zinc finger protein 821 isoform X2 [Clupea harengus]